MVSMPLGGTTLCFEIRSTQDFDEGIQADSNGMPMKNRASLKRGDSDD